MPIDMGPPSVLLRYNQDEVRTSSGVEQSIAVRRGAIGGAIFGLTLRVFDWRMVFIQTPMLLGQLAQASMVQLVPRRKRAAFPLRILRQHSLDRE
ncbi:hypothetical protein [Phaeovulum sp.]|uniref:hypothetical protein n=1 Tax=Phaeovulum sp. TaxID=2934796 RepID=UPI0039E55E03